MILVRLILTCVLLWFVYQETGPWTTATIGLMALSNEAFAWWMGNANSVLKKLAEKI